MVTAVLIGAVISILADPVTLSLNRSKARSDIQKIKTEILMYQASTGSLPTTEQGLRALVEKPGNVSFWRQFASTVPMDPWHHEFYYERPSRHHNEEGYDVYSAGPDGKPGTADDIGNWKRIGP